MRSALRRLGSAAAALCLACAAGPRAAAQDQPSAPAGERVAVVLDSGPVTNAGAAPATIFSARVEVDGAAWIRLHFSDVALPGSSRVVVTSLLDGDRQELGGAMMAVWGLSTAYFNGSVLLVEVVAAPGDGPCRVAVSHAEALLGAPMRGAPGQCGICGADDRTPASDDSVGRLMPVGCTATIICQDSTAISAGHCMTSGLVMQFRVPASQANCSTVAPPVADQFPVSSWSSMNAGVGADWAVATIGTNSLGQRPFDRYGARKTLAAAPAATGAAAVVRGFGVDQTCDRTQTLQESLGSITVVAATSYQFNCDIRGGNSGSSLVSGGAVIGVVTHCSVGCPNYGTRIDRPDFLAAINSRMACDDRYTLSVLSAPGAGMPIEVTPVDAMGLDNGVTAFSRLYPAYTSVRLSAPASLAGRCFVSWTVSGAAAVPAGQAVTFTMLGPVTATANFVTCCPADCDGSGSFTPSDVACFVNRWTASLANQDLTGDFDGNGVVAPADVAAFVAAWMSALASGGC